ncbi:hypothetical protein [Actinophytocola sp.]|jgi:hypothetical protein|uniref:hypothetical protein n=1 Tax=Actinophytocola sp. TaxID=1872138 RepID=UPI002D2C05DC|nr:hypothetical protein [Actinophytocola sp.]HYQ67816.1 hypothetical protein [Actinophytocola sp.]
MSMSSLLSKIGGALAMTGVVVATLFAMGATASASTTTCVDALLPPGHYCADGHPWHN